MEIVDLNKEGSNQNISNPFYFRRSENTTRSNQPKPYNIVMLDGEQTDEGRTGEGEKTLVTFAAVSTMLVS